MEEWKLKLKCLFSKIENKNEIFYKNLIKIK